VAKKRREGSLTIKSWGKEWSDRQKEIPQQRVTDSAAEKIAKAKR